MEVSKLQDQQMSNLDMFANGNFIVFHCQNLPVAKHGPLHHRCKASWRRWQAMPCLMHRYLWRWRASSWKAIPIALASWPEGGEGSVVGRLVQWTLSFHHAVYQGEQRVADIAMALEKESGNSCRLSRHVAHWSCVIRLVTIIHGPEVSFI